MNVLSAVKRALTMACVLYTIVISLMFAAGYAISDGAAKFVPTPSRALFILLFSVTVGAASLILSPDGKKAGRTLVHFLICAAAYILVFVVGGGYSPVGGAGVLAVVIFCAVYAITMAVRALLIRRKERIDVETDDTPYTPVFK